VVDDMSDEDRPYDAGDPKDVRARIKESQRWDDKRRTSLLASWDQKMVAAGFVRISNLHHSASTLQYRPD
jgi:hypothetical protein